MEISKKRRNGKKKSKRDDVVEDGLADVAYRNIWCKWCKLKLMQEKNMVK